MMETVQRQLLVKSEEERLVNFVSKLSVRGDVNNREMLILQLLSRFEARNSRSTSVVLPKSV